jgi:enamine deaminase RidA (YjgF/YER057c/UK114 family)
MAGVVRFSNPDTMEKPPGYTQVVEIAGSARTIYIAGQLGVDKTGTFVGAAGDFQAQCMQAFENLKAALVSVGAGFKDVVKINNYLVDMSHIAIFRAVRDSYLNTAAPPASTTVAIARLARPGALFEIEAIAVLPAKTATKSAAKPAGKRRSGRKVKVARRKRR